MKVTSHPFLTTFLNLTLEDCRCSYNWLLISFLPNIDVSDAENNENPKPNSRSNQKKIYPFKYLISTLSAPNFFTRPLLTQTRATRVHGMGWTEVFLQTGLEIGDTEQQNKLRGFRGGNGLHCRHISRDCDCRTYEADEPGISCNLKAVSNIRDHLQWISAKLDHRNNSLPPIPKEMWYKAITAWASQHR